jgi:riboflavin biosynthesis pyrimidine reductase
MTADGKIVTARGNPYGLTGPESRKWVQQLRRRADAVMVGINTFMPMNPCCSRFRHTDEPLAHHVDSRRKFRSQAGCHDHPDQTIVATTPLAAEKNVRRLEGLG